MNAKRLSKTGNSLKKIKYWTDWHSISHTTSVCPTTIQQQPMIVQTRSRSKQSLLKKIQLMCPHCWHHNDNNSNKFHHCGISTVMTGC